MIANKLKKKGYSICKSSSFVVIYPGTLQLYEELFCHVYLKGDKGKNRKESLRMFGRQAVVSLV